MVSLGKEIRLSRIFDKRTRKTVIVTIDHAIARGVLSGIKDVHLTIERVVEGQPNAITMHKGLANRCFMKFAGEVGLIIKTSSFSPYHPSYDIQLTSLEEAVRLGADAVAVGTAVGDSRQDKMLSNLSRLAKECDMLGMPLTAHIYPKGDMIMKDDYYKPENIMYAARTAAELGVDIVKTWYTGSPDTFKEVIRACPVPIVIAGGPKTEDVKSFLEMVRDAIDAGASGVATGRNIWQYQDPASMVRAVRLIVHEKTRVDEALKELEETKNN